jgi:hypothetical protein
MIEVKAVTFEAFSVNVWFLLIGIEFEIIGNSVIFSDPVSDELFSRKKVSGCFVLI